MNVNGKRGIRTLGTKTSYNGLAIRRFSPLSHLSQLKKDNYYVTLHKKEGDTFFISQYYLKILIYTTLLYTTFIRNL